jgi:transposase
MVGACSRSKGTQRVLVEKPEGKRPLGRHRCSGRIILRWIFWKWDGRTWIELIWLRTWTVGGHLPTQK